MFCIDCKTPFQVEGYEDDGKQRLSFCGRCKNPHEGQDMPEKKDFTVRELCKELLNETPPSNKYALAAFLDGYWETIDGENQPAPARRAAEHGSYACLYTYARDIALSNSREPGEPTRTVSLENIARMFRHACKLSAEGEL